LILVDLAKRFGNALMIIFALSEIFMRAALSLAMPTGPNPI
jgi:hypothetical protein